jgi:hypothetical protein
LDPLDKLVKNRFRAWREGNGDRVIQIRFSARELDGVSVEDLAAIEASQPHDLAGRLRAIATLVEKL